MTIHAAPTTLDSIKHCLVALRMPRALEVLDATLRRIEQGEIEALARRDLGLIKPGEVLFIVRDIQKKD